MRSECRHAGSTSFFSGERQGVKAELVFFTSFASIVVADPVDLVLLVSYGSGAGSDAFVIRVTERIDEARDLAPRTRTLLDSNKVYLEYGAYAKYRRKIRKAE